MKAAILPAGGVTLRLVKDARGVSFADGQANADRGYRFGVFEDDALRGQISLSEISRGAFQSAFV